MIVKKLIFRLIVFLGVVVFCSGNACIYSVPVSRVERLRSPFPIKASDVKQEKERIDLKRSYAYSDHVSDLPLLEGVGHPIAVSPTRQLRKIALKKGWEIMKI